MGTEFSPNLTDFRLLCGHLRKLDFANDDKSQPLDRIKASLVMNLAQALDVSIAETADSEEDFFNFAPFAKDIQTLKAYHTELCESMWVDRDLECFFGTIWAVTLRVLNQNHMAQPVVNEFDQDEEDLIDRCFSERNPFQWIRSRLFTVEGLIFDDEFMYRRFHNFITQLIANFPMKIKDWRALSEQECAALKANITSMKIPSLHFEELLLLIGDFYKTDRCRTKLMRYFFNISDGSQDARFNNLKAILFKFIRNSGESIHHYSILYVSYLHMLAGLCNDELTSRKCFAMLKEFGSSGPHLIPVSLDNCFRSLSVYYQILRCDSQHGILSMCAPSYGNIRRIAPDELKGLQYWLRLLTEIAVHDSDSRASFCDNGQWSCILNLLGLVGCEIPLELKSEALNFLAALAASGEIAPLLIEGLSASGIVTVSSADGRIVGIKQELDEVESRNEVYPVSSSLIHFMNCLISSCDPSQHSLKPINLYFELIINHVIVQLPNRAYRNLKEKWRLFALASDLMFSAVTKFDITPSTIAERTPGTLIFLHMLSDGPIFRLVISTLDAGVELLDRNVSFLGYDDFVQTIQNFLKLILVILQKQNVFINCLQDIKSTILTSSLDVLLRTINPKTGEPDYIVKILSYLTHFSILPRQCLIVVRIVAHLNTIFGIKSRLLRYFCFKPKLCSRILNGFASCLNLDELDASLNEETLDIEDFGTIPLSKVRYLVALAVLEFLIDDLRNNDGKLNEVSVGYFLLGFDLKDSRQTIFQNPGVDGKPKNCLHAALDIADAYKGHNLKNVSFGALFEPAYRLLYWLCANSSTSESVLRYLRNNYDFIHNHLKNLILVDYDETTKLVNQEIIGWLLKITAIELKSLSDLNRKSHVDRLLALLLHEDPDGSLANSSSSTKANKFKLATHDEGFKLINFLLYIRIDDQEISPPVLDFLDGKRLSQLIKAFTSLNNKQYSQCDVIKLHQLLRLEASSLQDTTLAGQAHLFYEEIERVLHSVVHYNKLQKIAYMKQHCLNAWRQLAEVMFYICDLNSLTIEQRVRFISLALVHLLKMDTLSEKFDLGTQSFTAANQPLETTIEPPYITVLDGTFVKNTEMDTLNELKHLSVLSTAFASLLEFMTKPENKRVPVTRALLYGSFMNFIRLTHSNETDDTGIQKAQYPSVKERMIEGHVSILSSRLIEIVALLFKDACDGPEMCKVIQKSNTSKICFLFCGLFCL